ncbi:MAG: hypothetical protein WCZ66_08395 [Sphingomonadaceae bacterium]
MPKAPAIVSVPEKTREEKRFARTDRNDDGLIQIDEYLSPRRRNFSKLDVNGDGKLSFEEYAKTGFDKFHGADENGNGVLDAAEFATLAPKKRNSAAGKSAVCNCDKQNDAE